MAAETERKTRLRLSKGSWRVDAFDPSIEGVAPITHDGTEVPSGKVKEVEAAAKRHGYGVTEIKEEG